MKIKISMFYKLALYAAIIAQLCIFTGLPLKINELVSFGVFLIASTNILAFVVLLIDNKKETKTNKETLRICLLALICVFSVFLSSAPIGDGVKKIVLFLQLPVYFIVSKKIDRIQAREFIYGVNLCYPVLFAFFANSSFSNRYTSAWGETVHENLTLGYGNPNETGIYIMLCLIVLISAIFYYKTIKMKMICLVETVYMGVLLLQTDCRAAIALTAAVLLATVFCKRISFGRFARNIIVFFPLGFVLLLLALPGLGDMKFLGSALDTGRSSLYLNYLDNLTLQKFLFGDFVEYPLNNMHNAYLTIAASLGIFVGIVFTAILYLAYKRCCMVSLQKKENMVLLLGLTAILIHSAVEAAVLVNGSVYAASVFLLYYLVISCDEIAQNKVN